MAKAKKAADTKKPAAAKKATSEKPASKAKAIKLGGVPNQGGR